MTIQDFIEKVKRSALSDYSVIIFTAQQYPILLCASLLEQLRLTYSPAPKRLMVENIELNMLYAQLMTTFLGQQDLLWCGDISGLDVQQKKRMLSLVGNYTGPHVLLCFIESGDLSDTVNKRSVIDLDALSVQDKDALISFAVPLLQKNQLSQMITADYDKMSLDMLVMFAKYKIVLGKNTDLFMKSWFQNLAPLQSSLFTLSQHFFSYKTKSFWTVWESIKHQYPEQFWITFWSEQLWRAYYVIFFLNQKSLAQAKQAAFRLPFSFIQKDWHLSSQDQLINAHQFLVNADFRSKNGGSDLFLDCFYTNFLLKQF